MVRFEGENLLNLNFIFFVAFSPIFNRSYKSNGADKCESLPEFEVVDFKRSKILEEIFPLLRKAGASFVLTRRNNYVAVWKILFASLDKYV